MTRRTRVAIAVVVVSLLAPVLFVVGAPPAAARLPSEDPIVTVHVRDNTFTPPRLAVKPGTVVRWVNVGRNRHNVTPNSGKAFGSGDLAPGQSYTARFGDAGNFAYYCSLHGAPGRGQHATVAVGDTATSKDAPVVGSGKTRPPRIAASRRTITVPGDARTIQGAVDRARRGDLVLVSPGVYHESVTVATDGVVLRGVDRNRTILDGDFEKKNGVAVLGADGVAVENLTARNFTENGFFWNDAQGYRGSYLTAYRNGDYGMYAFGSQWGTFDHSYASGSPDAGFYIGQCNPCRAVITDVVSEYNQLGYSGTNSSNLSIVRSVFRNNRTGMAPNSLSSEELGPQGHNTIVGNLIETNGSTDAAQTTDEVWDVVYGTGIAVVGGVGNRILRNHLPGNALAGIVIASNPGLDGHPFPATDNVVRGNTVNGTRVADLATALVTPSDGNCFADNQYGTSAPLAIEALMPCTGTSTGDANANALGITTFVDVAHLAPGRNYRDTPIPADQPNLPRARLAAARPAGAPLRVDVAAIARPS
jgi:plastocyanin